MLVNIAVVEDNELFREGIISLLEKNQNIRITGNFSNGKEFLDSLENALPDIVLMDIAMPVMDGITATRQSLLKYPHVKILVLTMFDDYYHYHEMLLAGVRGFVLKDAAVVDLETAIQTVLEGKTYFSNKLLQNIVHRLFDNKDSDVKKEIFSERELMFLRLISQGLSNKLIAEKMFVSIRTVESNKSKLFKKTKVKNSIELAAYAIKNNLIIT